MRITDPNAVVEGINLVGETLYIDAPGVTVRNPVIDGKRDVLYGISVSPNARRCHIVDPMIRGARNKGILTAGFTRVEGGLIHDVGEDGVFWSGDYVDVLGVTMHSNGWKVGGHADGVQCMGGGNFRIVGNRFILPHGENGLVSNSCVYVEPHWADIGPGVIAGNYCDGGLYSIWVIDGNYETNYPSVRVSTNILGRHEFAPMNIGGPVQRFGNRLVSEEVGPIVPDMMAVEPPEPTAAELDRFAAIVENDG